MVAEMVSFGRTASSTQEVTCAGLNLPPTCLGRTASDRPRELTSTGADHRPVASLKKRSAPIPLPSHARSWLREPPERRLWENSGDPLDWLSTVGSSSTMESGPTALHGAPLVRRLCLRIQESCFFRHATTSVVVSFVGLLCIEVSIEDAQSEASQLTATMLNVCTIIYGLELVVRIGASIERPWYSSRFILMDFIVCVAAVVEQALKLLIQDANDNVQTRIVQVLKLLRVVRLLKLSRIVSNWQSMRLLILSISRSREIVTAVIGFMGTVWIIVTCVMTPFLGKRVNDLFDEGDITDQAREGLLTHFGSIWKAFTTCMEVQFGGVNIQREVVIPLLHSEAWWSSPMAIACLAGSLVSSFCVLSLVLGIYVRQMVHLQRVVDEKESVSQAKHIKSFLRRLQKLVVKADTNSDGFISSDELLAAILVKENGRAPEEGKDLTMRRASDSVASVIQKYSSDAMDLEKEIKALLGISIEILVALHKVLDEAGCGEVHIDVLMFAVARILGDDSFGTTSVSTMMCDFLRRITRLRAHAQEELGFSLTKVKVNEVPYNTLSTQSIWSSERDSSAEERVPLSLIVAEMASRVSNVHANVVVMKSSLLSAKWHLLHAIDVEDARMQEAIREADCFFLVGEVRRQEEERAGRKEILEHLDVLVERVRSLGRGLELKELETGSQFRIAALRGLVRRRLQTEIGPWFKAEYAKAFGAVDLRREKFMRVG